jgi:hypothetical protein
MGNIFNPDFQDFIHALNQAEVKYILIGGYAVILHGYNRSTGDMDIWVERTVENYQRLQEALRNFGMPFFDMTLDNFLHNEQVDVFRFGKPPASIDIINRLKGLSFDETYKTSIVMMVEDLKVRVLSLEGLKQSKTISGRPKDKDDLDHLS